MQLERMRSSTQARATGQDRRNDRRRTGKELRETADKRPSYAAAMMSLKEGEFRERHPILIVLLRNRCKCSLSEARANPSRQEQHTISGLEWWF